MSKEIYGKSYIHKPTPLICRAIIFVRTGMPVVGLSYLHVIYRKCCSGRLSLTSLHFPSSCSWDSSFSSVLSFFRLFFVRVLSCQRMGGTNCLTICSGSEQVRAGKRREMRKATRDSVHDGLRFHFSMSCVSAASRPAAITDTGSMQMRV